MRTAYTFLYFCFFKECACKNDRLIEENNFQVLTASERDFVLDFSEHLAKLTNIEPISGLDGEFPSGVLENGTERVIRGFLALIQKRLYNFED